MSTVDVHAIEVLEASPADVGDPELQGAWPCPFCGLDRQLDGAHSVRVRNRDGGAFERWVLMCDGCLRDAQ